MQGDLSGDSELCAAREFLGEGRLKGTFRFLELPPGKCKSQSMNILPLASVLD